VIVRKIASCSCYRSVFLQNSQTGRDPSVEKAATLRRRAADGECQLPVDELCCARMSRDWLRRTERSSVIGGCYA